MEYKSSLMVHVLKVNGSLIDNILALLYGLMAPNTRVISVVLCSKVKVLSRLTMKSLMGNGKTANLKVKERGG